MSASIFSPPGTNFLGFNSGDLLQRLFDALLNVGNLTVWDFSITARSIRPSLTQLSIYHWYPLYTGTGAIGVSTGATCADPNCVSVRTTANVAIKEA
jgi:hypothetical protein